MIFRCFNILLFCFLIFHGNVLGQSIAEIRKQKEKSEKEISYLNKLLDQAAQNKLSSTQKLNILQEKINLDSEKIMEIAEFRIEGFLKDFAGDFSDKTQGETVFITENMLDQFIEEYVPVMLEELRAVKKNKSILVAKDYKWKRGKK